MKARIPTQPTQTQPSCIGDVFERFPLLFMFYLLPVEYVAKISYEKFPRSPYEFSQSKAWQKAYKHKLMTLLLSDAWAYIVWPHFGIKAPMESFTGYDPAWITAHCTPMLQDAYLKMKGMRLTDLRRLSTTTEFTFPSLEDATVAAHIMAEGLRRFHLFDEVMEIVDAHRDFKDFENHRRNYRKTDLFRKHYHTRASIKTVSTLKDNGEHKQIAEVNFDIDNLVTSFWIESFFARLKNKTDITICKLLYWGRTQQEIADYLGYANHSAVNKRVQKIRNELQAFIDEQNELKKAPPQVNPDIKYDIIPFEYKRT